MGGAFSCRTGISPVWLRLSVRARRYALTTRSSYTVDMDSETVERLETQIAFLESANLQLGEVVYRQQQEIRELRARIDALAQQMAAVQAVGPTARTLEDERPPHY